MENELITYEGMEVRICSELSEKENLDFRVMLRLCPEYVEKGVSLYSLTENDIHFIAYKNQRLLAVFGFSESGTAQAVVHPAYRKQGVFTQLYHLAKEKYPQVHFTFFVMSTQDQAMAVMDAMGIPLESTEHFMRSRVPRLNLEEKKIRLSGKNVNGVTTMVFFHESEQVGQCELYPYGGDIEVVGMEIFPAFRRCGYGLDVLSQIIRMESVQKKRVYVQVSEENVPAFSLYQKLGFEITDTVYVYGEVERVET